MTIPLELEADNPAVVYLESLSKGSYWAVRHSLETIAEILAGEHPDLKVVSVDFHAEATSEKQALAFYLDGRVSAVLGTHTHVSTADERASLAAPPWSSKWA